MSSSKPLLVLALGGHGLSRPNEADYLAERFRIAQLRFALAQLAAQYRLLLVHGNGPQVGRLLRDGRVDDLDIHTAQTQGELGYLLVQTLPSPALAVITRVTVNSALGPAIKPIGPILESKPDYGESLPVQNGWRIAVPSPQPQAVLETQAIRELLRSHHVVAGGGGGVPLNHNLEPVNAVVDKDWVAAQLASSLAADMLVFATDVPFIYQDFSLAPAQPIEKLDLVAAETLLEQGLDAGSMAPKLGSAISFVKKTDKRACICSVEDIVAAVSGQTGTQIGKWCK